MVNGFPMQVDKFSMGIQLDVYPPEGGDPYEVDYVFPTARMKAPLSVGMEVPVKVMADDPMAVAVQWDALKGSIAASGGDMAVAMQGIQNTYAGTADAAGRQYLADKADADAEAAAKVAANDPAERLKKLSQLKDAGLSATRSSRPRRPRSSPTSDSVGSSVRTYSVVAAAHAAMLCTVRSAAWPSTVTASRPPRRRNVNVSR